MPTIEVKHSDELLNLLKNKLQQGQLIPMTPTTGTSYRFSVPTTEAEASAIIANSNNNVFSNYAFNFNTDSKVFPSQAANFNAAEFYKTSQSISEISIKSIYQYTSEQLQQIFENFELGIHVEPLSGESLQRISINDRLEKAEIISNKDYFPFYNIFNFTNTPNLFYKFLLDNDVYDLMIEAFDSLNLSEESFETNAGPVSFKTIDLFNLFSNLPSDPQNFKIHHSPSFSESERWGLIYDNLDKMLFDSYLEKFVNENAPSYYQILTEDKNPFIETIFYRIEKYKLNSTAPLQVFYIPASDSNRDFIDNQVVFGAEYNYKIYAIGAVFGNEYTYSTKVTGNGGIIDIVEKKISKLFQINIHDYNVLLKGIAPSKPEITFMNNSGPDKSIRIYFEPDFHATRESFVEILESDSENQSFAMRDNEHKVIHRLNKDFLNFQIFKLNKKPTSYDDFSNSLYAEVIGADISSSEVYRMFLTPNKKHYFTFRSKNRFNLFSNPTPIYEVELIQDADETKILSKIVSLKKESNDRIREFGRFLRIYPAFEQVVLREFEPSDISFFDNMRLPEGPRGDTPTLKFNNKQYYVGSTDHPVWGKKFKFRIRSKNTGKIIDINVNFTLKKKESEADF